MTCAKFDEDRHVAWTPRNCVQTQPSAPTPRSIARQYYATSEWASLRSAILTALIPFPDAKASVARAVLPFDAIDDGHD